MTYIDKVSTYEEAINNAKLSFLRNEELERTIKHICFQEGLDKESSWAILECFRQKI